MSLGYGCNRIWLNISAAIMEQEQVWLFGAFFLILSSRNSGSWPLYTHTVDRAIFLSTLSAYKAGDPKTCGTPFSTAAKLCDALVIFALLICLFKIPSKYSVSQNKQGLSTLLLLLLLLLSCPLIKSDSQAGMFELEVNQGQAELEQGIPPLESWSLSTKTGVKQRENQ